MKSPQGAERSWHRVFCVCVLSGFERIRFELYFGATSSESCLLISWKLNFPNPDVLVFRDGMFPAATLNLPWLFFSMEVGMLMYPAPHCQPPVWACVGRLFFLSFVLFPLPILVDLGQDVACVYVCPGWQRCSTFSAPYQAHLPPEERVLANPWLGRCWLLSGVEVRLLCDSYYVSFPFVWVNKTPVFL